MARSALAGPPLRPGASVNSAEAVAEYIFAELRARDHRQWLGSRQPKTAKPSAEERVRLRQKPLDLLKTYQLKGVGLASHSGLVGWLEDRYRLDLRTDIPSPMQMFEAQCHGRRFVTWLADPARQKTPIGRHAGALEFTLHDLEHAHKFFGDPILHAGQVRFFARLSSRLSDLKDLGQDPLFRKDLDYLISDMNSHPVHMAKYLKAILLTVHIRNGREAEYEEFCRWFFARWGLSDGAFLALDRINRPGEESTSDHATISEWFLAKPFDTPSFS